MCNTAPFSVLMSVYYKNSPEELYQAIKSIWSDQTLKPSQIVIVEDGELPKELQNTLDYWADQFSQIFTIVKLHQNSGLGNALNAGLEHCQYELVARMDADDVSTPDRFIRQFNFMIHHPDIDVLGGQIEEWDERLEFLLAKKTLPLSHNELLFFSKYRCPFNHPSVMFRKKKIKDAGGYPCKKLEDNYLWINLLLKGSKFSNLNSVIVKMRADKMLKSRRGLSVLLPELKLQKYLYDCGINNLSEMMVNCAIRTVLRLLPHRFRLFMYKTFR